MWENEISVIWLSAVGASSSAAAAVIGKPVSQDGQRRRLAAATSQDCGRQPTPGLLPTPTAALPGLAVQARPSRVGTPDGRPQEGFLFP